MKIGAVRGRSGLAPIAAVDAGPRSGETRDRARGARLGNQPDYLLDHVVGWWPKHRGRACPLPKLKIHDPSFYHLALPAVIRLHGRSMRTLLATAFLVVAAINDKLQSWVSYLFGASLVIEAHD
jgi:hypothetical protein